MRTLLTALALALSVAPALAQTIDLSEPWGNRDGCRNRVQQEVFSENMLLLDRTRLVTSASACTITGTDENADGSLTLSASCEMEGESSPVETRFTVERSKTGSTLSIIDPEGNLFGEVAPCS